MTTVNCTPARPDLGDADLRADAAEARRRSDGWGGVAAMIRGCAVRGTEVAPIGEVTVNVRVTSAPTLPRSSVPTTWKRCTPPARPMIVTESGQGPNGSSSIRHAHVPGSSAVRRTATGARTIPPSSGSATVTTGPVVSTVNVRRATGVTSPPKSRARTSNVCVPSARPA